MKRFPALRRCATVLLSVSALSWTATLSASADAGDPPNLPPCYELQVSSPPPGPHPSVEVCRPV